MKKPITAVLAWSLMLVLTACGSPFVNQDMMEPEPAYEHINIYYVSDDAIESESIYLPCSAAIIFNEWAVKNSIDVVSAPEFKREDNMQVIYPDDPDNPAATTTVIPPDHAVLYITLPSEFEIYFEGETGQLTAESLKKTFLGFWDYDEVYLSVET